jgi:hypothetical protein
MAEAGWTTRLGATPGRLGVVAILAVALVAVVLLELGDSSTPASASQNLNNVRQKPRLAEKTSTPASAAKTAMPPSDAPPRPKVPLEEAIQHDPFALAPALAKLAAAQSAASSKTRAPHGQADERSQRIKQAVTALRNKGVQMVVLGKGEKLAILGDRPIRVGDVVEGLQVIAITPRGITLSEQRDRRD